MFESKAAMFLYAISPVHMGAGTAIGAIDNPIQRERHTGHPMIAGSGLKGALRHEATALWQKADGLVERVFGPDVERGNAADHAGALSVSDAQIVLFPVRSLRQSYVYATCPTALGRLRRLLDLLGVEHPLGASLPALQGNQCIVSHDGLKSNEHLVLETFQFAPAKAGGAELKRVGEWLATHALPADGGSAYFRGKVGTDTVLLADDRFNYFVRNATVVEPHVRINDERGTADDGGLFYTENLPPESLLVSLVMASRERGGQEDRLPAADVLGAVCADQGSDRPGFEGRMIQVGGDATTGRGQVLLRFAMKG